MLVSRPTEINFQGNEQRPLLGENLNSSVPWAEDHRWWVRMPAQQIVLATTIFRNLLSTVWKDFTWALLISLPFALLGVPQGWVSGWVFALNYFALIALESRFISTAEWIWLFSDSTMTTIVAEALPHTFPLMVGITAIVYGEITLVQSFIIGSLIANLLMGTGLSWFVGGLRFREQTAPTTAMKSIVSLTMITVFPFIPPMFIGPLYEAYPRSRALFTLTVADVIVMLVIYAMWLCFRYSSHAELFEKLEEANAGSTANDGSPTSGAVNGRFSGQGELSTASRLNYAIWLIAILVLAIQCSVYLIQDIPRFVQDTSLSRIFIGAALLPFTSSLSSFAKTCAIAYDNRMELAMHLTAETALGVGLFNLPILIIASVCIGHRMLLEFDVLLEVFLFITAVTTAFTTGYGLFTYLKGAIHLGLYVPPPASNDRGFIID
ncbi:hypothetical protein N7519_005187 [Penicillium mononematosum]|uniref:uncharacterized protein n=1 Tax=Penicillium mononematosum TaxID=268346 RepID=UPI002548565C|nr:uncharacterized protein N7519_005187 [Penicillium mononematosum]KAJ6183886.1 hypothetical protein N7519_005187 [Penicillium mononematosum]